MVVAMQAVVSTTVSPYRATIAPLACFAIFPVSKISGRPPTSTVTECGTGIEFLSAIRYFLWLRVHAERVCRQASRPAARPPRTSVTFYWKKRGENPAGLLVKTTPEQLHHESLRPNRDCVLFSNCDCAVTQKNRLDELHALGPVTCAN